MRIKRVEANSVAEAIRELRRDLGDHALILHTKHLPSKGLTGWFKTPRVEILGAVDEPELLGGRSGAAAGVATPAATTSAAPENGQRFAIDAPGVDARRKRVAAGVATPAAAPVSTSAVPAMAAAVIGKPALEPAQPSIKTRKGKKGQRPEVPAADPQRRVVAERLARFRAANPAIPLADEEARADVTAATLASEAAAAATQANDLMAGISFSTAEWTRAGRRARRIALVGPTGAGKTTTLAKLAARAHLEQGRRVGLVTIDTYRIGAVPQLRAYADILGVPLEVAATPDELSHALARLADCDVIFIDTIGRSPLGGGVDGLVPFLAVAGADEIHLVLSATTRPQDSIRAARSFVRLAPNRLVITKVDETDDYAAVTEVSRATGLPLTWLGTGQEVPDDIEEATPARLASLLATGCAA